jgi:hypothetical protein
VSGINHLSPSALAYHSIIFLNLAGSNVVDLRAAVVLTDPSRRAIVVNGRIDSVSIPNGQRGFVRSTPDDSPLQRVPVAAFIGASCAIDGARCGARHNGILDGCMFDVSSARREYPLQQRPLAPLRRD